MLSWAKSCLLAALASCVFLLGTSMLMNLKLGEPFGRDPKIATQSSKDIVDDFMPERPSPANRPVSGKPEPTSNCLPRPGLVRVPVVVTEFDSVVDVGDIVGERR